MPIQEHGAAEVALAAAAKAVRTELATGSQPQERSGSSEANPRGLSHALLALASCVSAVASLSASRAALLDSDCTVHLEPSLRRAEDAIAASACQVMPSPFPEVRKHLIFATVIDADQYFNGQGTVVGCAVGHLAFTTSAASKQVLRGSSSLLHSFYKCCIAGEGVVYFPHCTEI